MYPTNKRIGLTIVTGLAVLIISIYLSFPAVFLALLLGFLFVPPAFAFLLILIEGIPVIIKESRNLLASGQRFLVISTSGESIILEPR